jgi:hypothetical protein
VDPVRGTLASSALNVRVEIYLLKAEALLSISRGHG